MAENRYFALLPQDTVNSKELNSLPVTARWIYVVMVAEDHGLRVPFTLSYTRIRQITGLSRPTIRKAVIELAKAGYLSYEHGGLECNPNVYDLNADWLKME
jgi:hypothetical protein